MKKAPSAFFRRLDNKELRRLARGAEQIEHPVGVELVRYGKLSFSLFMILVGSCEVQWTHPQMDMLLQHSRVVQKCN
ncbi:hypothetical protein T484DRAFT_1842987 [Baffinella frigidus]|nr:hypothetical protein T484DRAFT_1842987 [Cryptophyta sp. CCMP2293]